jgi:hypothetical protein
MKNLSKAPILLKWCRMTPQSQLIFDKSDSVHSKTFESKNHSHMLKLKNSEVIFINCYWNLGYMSLNYSWKNNPNGSTLVDWFGQLTKPTKKP